MDWRFGDFLMMTLLQCQDTKLLIWCIVANSKGNVKHPEKELSTEAKHELLCWTVAWTTHLSKIVQTTLQIRTPQQMLKQHSNIKDSTTDFSVSLWEMRWPALPWRIWTHKSSFSYASRCPWKAGTTKAQRAFRDPKWCPAISEKSLHCKMHDFPRLAAALDQLFFNAAIYNSNRQPSILDPSPAKYLMPWPHVRVHVCNAQRDQVNPRQTDWHKQRNPCPSHVTIKTLCTSLLKVAEQTPFRPFEFKPSHIHSHAANVMCLCATMCNLSWKAAHTRPSTKFHRPWVLLHPLDPQANDVWSMASAKGLHCRCKGLRVTTTQTTLCRYAGCQELQYIDALRIQLCFASKAQKLLACSYGYSTGTGGTGIDNMKILCCALWWGKVV